ncbi:MAG: adenylate/guanylate cyclase domain-containing protein [Acidimicrobiia bacterium]
MHEPVDETFWERLASRTRPSGALVTIEDPMTTVRLLTGALGMTAVITGFGGLLMVMFDEPAVGWAYWALSATFVAAWVWYAATGSTRAATIISLLGSVVLLVVAHLALGGYANSGAQLMWAIGLTMVSALLLGRTWTIAVATGFIVLAVVMGFLEQSLSEGRSAPDTALSAALFSQVLVGTVVLLPPLFVYVLGQLSFERERAESLLLNVLPEVVAAELKLTGTTTARRCESVSVLFADIVGFTPLSAEMEPEEMVDQLNEVFTYFDTLADKYGCEKIRTIGDAYMVASGVPTPRNDHAQALAAMALEMLDYSSQGRFSFRLGINSGPVVAGVIGTRKFQYDVWGDTVNTASRMESHSQPDKIQISEATNDLIKEDFETTPRGPIEIKGKGELTTWYLERKREAATARR